MSPDLARALHAAVDGGPDDAPFDVGTLTGRIRRRRTVRAGVRSGVAVGAVGAVAIGAVQVGSRDPYSALPAARADAAPGTCGSDIGLIPTADPPTVGLLTSPYGTTDLSASLPAPGTSLGRYLGRTLDPLLVREMPPEARAAAFATAVRYASTALADAQERRDKKASGSVPLSPGQLAALDRAVEAARQELEQAEESPYITGDEGSVTLDGLDDPRTALLVTHGGTVVATDPAPLASGTSHWFASVQQSSVTNLVDTELRTCASPGDPGDVPLPAGEYAVYVSYEEAGDRVAAGPWPLTLLTARSPSEAELPAAFPADAVPLVGGRLLAVSPASGGWDVEIAVDGDDAAAVALRLLGDDVATASAIGFTHEGRVRVDGWEVQVASSTSDDGEATVVYTIRPS